MTDITDPSGASLRLSNDERERAVAALQTYAAQGRITDAELQTRSTAARAAVTRGDLAPLFSDLPGGLHLDAHGPQPGAQPASGAAYPGPQNAQQPYPPQQPYAQPYPPQQAYDGRGGSGWSGREPSSRWGLLAVSIIPFVSLILFFITGAVWGYQFSWLWFLLIPLVGAIAYGTDGGRRR
ncbi:DUF1707 domain-containing protein [Leifsonia sp. 2TAF2]|uniref:DUF1707 SHOCT-like domain-containing protein n=1 Tax=Leifsonia sp. 2TAF2 TaxID=3233009 RepID=UPI003F973CA8